MNWQNIPRDDKAVKKAVIPKRGAFSLFDYSQIEPRLAAYFAAKIGYPEFAEKIRSGVDSYTAVSQLATGKEDITPEERQVWKRIFLAILYGAGVRRVGEVWLEETGKSITQAQAKNIVNTFHKNWPAVKELQRRVQGAVQKRGYMVGLDGRHLHLEEYGEHKLLNKLIQGSAAGIMKQAMLNVYRHLRDREVQLETRMLSVVHDELIFDGPTSEIHTLHVEIPPLMIVRHDVHEVVPIIVEHEVSTTTWAEKIEYDEWAQAQEVAA